MSFGSEHGSDGGHKPPPSRLGKGGRGHGNPFVVADLDPHAVRRRADKQPDAPAGGLVGMQNGIGHEFAREPLPDVRGVELLRVAVDVARTPGRCRGAESGAGGG